MYRHSNNNNVISFINHITPEQWALAVGVTLVLALISFTRRTLIRDAVLAMLRNIWREIVHIFSFAKPGIRIGRARLSDEARLRHTHIVGATGSGKTVLMEQLILEDIKRGQGMLIIDPKGDKAFREKVQDMCLLAGRSGDFHLLCASQPHLSARWNPCRVGDQSELQTKLYNAGVYHEPFYAKACEFALIEAINNLSMKSAQAFTLADVEAVVKRLNPQKGQETHIYLIPTAILPPGNTHCLRGLPPFSEKTFVS